MSTGARKLLAALFASCLVFAGLAGTAAADHTTNHQDGLINVAVYDIVILDDGSSINVLTDSFNNLDIGVAAQIAANVCGVKVGPLAVLGQAVDRSGTTRTACETGDQLVEFQQN